MANRRIEYTPLPELIDALTNAKEHDQQAIGRSLDQFGYVEPIVVDERTQRLVVGHGRVTELRDRFARGEQPPEGIENAGAWWLVPVVRGWASKDDAEAEAYGVAANRLIESGGWKVAPLATMLQQIEDSATTLLAATGFTPDDLDDLVARAGQGVLAHAPFGGGFAETPAEEAARVPKNPTTRADLGLHDVVLPYRVKEWAEYNGLVETLRRRWKCTPGEAVVRAMKIAR